VRKLLLVLAVLPIGIALSPSLAPAWECDPAISRGTCGGSGQKYPAIGRLAVRDPVASMRTLAGKPSERDEYAGARSVWPDQAAKPASAHATAFGAISVAMSEELSGQPGVDVPKEGRDKGSPAPSSPQLASQPGNAALLIAAVLGMGAMARRRIASILG
jgi:hypothetical protein